MISIGKNNKSLEYAAELLIVAALFGIMVIVTTWPLIFNLGLGLSNFSDSLMMIWGFERGIHAILKDPLNFYNAGVYYPFPNPLTYCYHTFGHLPLWAFFRIFTDNSIIIHNLIALFGFWTSAIAMYVFFRFMDGTRYGAFAAGSIFGLNPFILFYINDIGNTQFEFIPLCALTLFLFSRRGEWKYWLLFVIFSWYCLLLPFYTAYNDIFIVVIFSIILVITDGKRILTKLNIIAGALYISLTAVVFSLIFIPYFENMTGGRSILRSASELIGVGPVLPWSYFDRDQVGFAIGIAVIVGILLFLVSSRSVKKDNRIKYLYRMAIIATPVGLILSFGVKLISRDGIEFDALLPGKYLMRILPFFSAFRDPSKWLILFFFGASIATGIGFQHFTNYFSRNKYISFCIMILWAAFVAADSRCFFYQSQPVRNWDDRPVFYKMLKMGEFSGPRLDLPIDERNDFAGTTIMAFSNDGWNPMIGGALGLRPEGYDDVLNRIFKLPDQLSVDYLSVLGTKWVAVHNDLPGEICDWSPQILKYPPPLGWNATLVRDDSEEMEFEISDSPRYITMRIQLEDLIEIWAAYNRKVFVEELRTMGVYKIIATKNDDSPPPGRSQIEITGVLPNDIKPIKGCRDTMYAVDYEKGDVYLGIRLSPLFFKACEGGRFGTFINSLGAEKIYLYNFVNVVNPLKGYSVEELEKHGLRLYKKAGTVDVYEIINKVEFTNAPLKGFVGFSFGHDPVKIDTRLELPENKYWRNPNLGRRIILECRFKREDGKVISKKEIAFSPPPVMQPGELFVELWDIPKVIEKGRYSVECGGNDVSDFSTNVVELPLPQ